jgi:hypothetical protein
MTPHICGNVSGSLADFSYAASRRKIADWLFEVVVPYVVLLSLAKPTHR